MDSKKRGKDQGVEGEGKWSSEEENGAEVTWKQDVTTKDQVGCCRFQ